MNLTLILILGVTLFFLCFIVFKIVISQSPFNINANVNNNNKVIKNSFNTVNDNSVNVKNVTNINVQSSKKILLMIMTFGIFFSFFYLQLL